MFKSPLLPAQCDKNSTPSICNQIDGLPLHLAPSLGPQFYTGRSWLPVSLIILNFILLR